MSQDDSQECERGDLIADDHLNQPPSAPTQPSQEKNGTDLGDSSEPLFTMYSKIAEEEDNKQVDRWQKDAEGIIIFTGLFSAVIGALIVVSIQDLRPNPQDSSTFYLANLYRLQLDPNISRSSLPLAPPPFSPPRYAVWVNTLWFLTLVISLSCAMLATSLQQWARRYLRITQPVQCSPHKRARVHAFFANGVDKFRVPWAVEALPALIHLSLFTFFAGLLIYLSNIDPTVFSAVAYWMAILVVIYGCITLLPIFWHDSPYYSPLSSTIWVLYAGVLYVALKAPSMMGFRFSSLKTYRRISELSGRYRRQVHWGVERAAEEAASTRSSEIDGRVMEWTIDTLSEDDALEQFFETIPGFYKSVLVKDLRQGLPGTVQWKILHTLAGYLHRTLSSNLVSGPVKVRRLAICLNAASEIQTSLGIPFILDNIISGTWFGVSHSVEIGHFLRSWDKTSNGRYTLYVDGIIARIVASARDRNDRWVALTLDYSGVPERTLRDYLAHGDSVLLANLIHIVRRLSRSDWVPITILESLSEFDVRNTVPELQRDFCALWNEIVRETGISGSHDGVPLLMAIRRVYLALHRGTVAAPTAFDDSTSDLDYALTKSISYPLCNLPGHRSDNPPEHRDTVPHSAGGLSRDGAPASTIITSRPAPRLHAINPSALLDPTTAILKQGTVDHTTIVTSPTAGSDLDSALAAKTLVPQSVFNPSSSRTNTPPRHSTHRLPSSSSMVPRVPFSPSPPPPAGNMYSMDLQSSPVSASSQSIQSPLNMGHSPPDSAAIPLIARRQSSVSGGAVASNIATRGGRDDSQGQNDTTIRALDA